METISELLLSLREYLDTTAFDELIRNPYVLGIIAVVIIIGIIKKSPGTIVVVLSIIAIGFLMDTFLPEKGKALEDQQMNVVALVAGLAVIGALNIYVFFIRSD